MAVGEMAAVGKIHTENLIAVLNCREIDSHVRLCPAMRLDVRVFGAKQLLGTIDCRLLHNIGPFAASVVTLTWIALGVLVGEDGTHRFENGFTDEVFGGDQFKSICLSRYFVVDSF